MVHGNINSSKDIYNKNTMAKSIININNILYVVTHLKIINIMIMYINIF